MQRHNKRQRQSETHQYFPLPNPTPPLTATTVITDQIFACMNNKPTFNARRRVPISYIEDRTRRHITFSKRKAGLIKKANELACLTGTEIMLLVASEAGTVYFHTTDRFRPLVDSPKARQHIAECLIAGRPRGPCTSLDTTMENQPLNLGPPLSNSGRPLICKFVRMIPPDSTRNKTSNSANNPPESALESEQTPQLTVSDPIPLDIPTKSSTTTNFTTTVTGYHHPSITTNNKFPAPMPFQTPSVFDSYTPSAYVPPARTDSKMQMRSKSSSRTNQESSGRIQYPLSPNLSNETTYNANNLASSETPYVFNTQTPYVLSSQNMSNLNAPGANKLFSCDQSSPLDDIFTAQPGTVNHYSAFDNNYDPNIYTNSVQQQLTNFSSIPGPIPTSNTNNPVINQHNSCSSDPVIPTSNPHATFDAIYNNSIGLNNNSIYQQNSLQSDLSNHATALNMITDPIEYVNAVVRQQQQQLTVSSSDTDPHSAAVNQQYGFVYDSLPDPYPTSNQQPGSCPVNNSAYTIPEPILASAGYPITSTNPLSMDTTAWPEPLSTISTTIMSSDTTTSAYPPAALDYVSMNRLLSTEYCSLLPCDQQAMYAVNNVLNGAMSPLATADSSIARYRGAGTY